MEDQLFFQVEMGQRVSQFPISKYKGSTQKKDMITLIHNNPMVSKTQYHPDVGNFYILKAATDMGIDPRVHYNFMIVQWKADFAGKIVSWDDWEIKILSIGGEYYESLIDKYDLNGDLTGLILQVRCSDDKFQKFTFEVAGAAPFKEQPELQTKILNQVKELQSYVPKVIAKKISEKVFLEKVKAGRASESDFIQQQIAPTITETSPENIIEMGGGEMKKEVMKPKPVSLKPNAIDFTNVKEGQIEKSTSEPQVEKREEESEQQKDDSKKSDKKEEVVSSEPQKEKKKKDEEFGDFDFEGFDTV